MNNEKGDSILFKFKSIPHELELILEEYSYEEIKRKRNDHGTVITYLNNYVADILYIDINHRTQNKYKNKIILIPKNVAETSQSGNSDNRQIVADVYPRSSGNYSSPNKIRNYYTDEYFKRFQANDIGTSSDHQNQTYFQTAPMVRNYQTDSGVRNYLSEIQPIRLQASDIGTSADHRTNYPTATMVRNYQTDSGVRNYLSEIPQANNTRTSTYHQTNYPTAPMVRNYQTPPGVRNYLSEMPRMSPNQLSSLGENTWRNYSASTSSGHSHPQNFKMRTAQPIRHDPVYGTNTIKEIHTRRADNSFGSRRGYSRKNWSSKTSRQ